MYIIDWLHKKLIQKLEKRKREVIRLKWSKIQLEQKLKELKEE